MKTCEDRKTLREAVDAIARIQPEAPFLMSPETGIVVSCQKLQQESVLLSAMLRSAGLERGDKVALLMDNGLLTVQLFLGTIYGGYAIVPLNVRAGAMQLAYMLDHCDAKVVFVEEQYIELVREAMEGIRREIRVVIASGDGPMPAFEEADVSFQQLPLEADDVALLMYSSGSTGRPNAAIHTHSSVLAGGWNSIEAHQLSSTDRSLLVLPLYHINAECVTLIPTLLSGGSVVVAHRFVVAKFWDWVDDLAITWSALVPTIISELVDWEDPKKEFRAAAFQRIRFFRSSSAPLSPLLHRQFVDKFNLPLLQAMGSTEGGNVFSNPQPPGKNKIGSPGLPWGFEARIVNRDGLEVPAGESGEVRLRGAALMRAYYKDPEGTAAVLDGDGWLHTGDLARRDEDGYFFIVGRSKELIIKGGVNIAPRQIDEVLESHPAVLEAAAVGVPDRYFGEDAVAFVVLRPDVTSEERELLAFCESRLGHFKTPSRIRFLKELPKGPSGKVQRLRLLDPAVLAAVATTNGSEGKAIAATDGSADNLQSSPSLIEQIIATSWADVLGVTEVDRNTNFFALGGHSLLAIQCLSKLREKIPIVLSITDFFENGTISEQSELVRQRLRPHNGASATDELTNWEQTILQQSLSTPAEEAIPLRDSSLPCPLSLAQERLWFLEQLDRPLPVYNEAEAVRLTGELNVDRLERALNVIVARHEVLRSTIKVVDGMPHAEVHESWPLRFERIDLSALPLAERESEVDRLLIDKPRTLYDLESQPGIRVALLRLSSREHVLILMMHHIVCDWSSEGIIWRELSALYRSFNHDMPANLTELPIAHGDYAAWQRQQIEAASFDEDLAFWEEKLRNASPLLEIPADRVRPPVMSHKGGRLRRKLSGELTEALRNRSRQEKVSLFTIFAAGLNTLLYRYTGSNDILLGLPLADREHQQVQSMIGFLLHTHVLRTQFAGDMTFRDLLIRVQKEVLELYTHRAIPFDQIVQRLHPERNLSYSPLFQVMLNWRDQDQSLPFIGLDGIAIDSLMAHSGTSKFDLFLFATDSGNEIWLELEYSSDLFDEDRIERMLSHYQTILEAAAADPTVSIAKMPLLMPSEYQQIVVEWNRTESAYPADKCLDELIGEQIERTPDSIAVVSGHERMTYRQLGERADHLASHLQELGVRRNTLVAICVGRSAEMVVGLLGILRAGGAYLPLDPMFPPDRLAFMLEDAQPIVLLTEEKLLPRLSPQKTKVVCLDSFLAARPHRPELSALSTGREPSDLAYVLYTSGSTGKPKGVQIQHSALVNFMTSMQWEPGITASDTMLALTTLSFDIAGLELFLPLTVGARVVIASSEVAGDGAQLLALMERSKVTIMQATPVTWRLLLLAHWKGSSELKILCGGESWTTELANELRPRCQSLWNMYGPTETTIWSSVSRVEKGTPVLIGRPIANTTFYILDVNNQPVPIGIPGELCIGGSGLALGYLGRPELTNERFVTDRFNPQIGAKLYKTGDLVQRTPAGSIEFLRRIDNQVKLRGFRIELGEIQSSLERYDGVRECVVMVQGESSADQRLVAYVVLADSENIPTVEDLKRELKKSLPSYMIPSTFSVIESMPLTPNGKVDRKQLSLSVVTVMPSQGSADAPRDAIEFTLVQIWERVIGISPIGIRTNFFDVGGYSLMVVRLFAEIDKAFDRSLPIASIFELPTIEQLAKLIRGDAINSAVVPIRPSGTKEPLFIVISYLTYERFRQVIEPDRPLFGLREREDDLERLCSIKDRVAEYVQQIRETQPQGPYNLIGWCAAGPLTIELARGLQDAGEKVAMLGLIDAAHPRYSSKLKLRRNKGLFISRFREALSYHNKRRAQPTPVGAVRYFGRLLRGKALDGGRRFVLRERGLLLNFCRRLGISSPPTVNILNTLITDNIEPYDGCITLFRPLESNVPHFDQTLGWSDVALGGVDVVSVPGDHESMFKDGNVIVFGQLIQEALEKQSCTTAHGLGLGQ